MPVSIQLGKLSVFSFSPRSLSDYLFEYFLAALYQHVNVTTLPPRMYLTGALVDPCDFRTLRGSVKQRPTHAVRRLSQPPPLGKWCQGASRAAFVGELFLASSCGIPGIQEPMAKLNPAKEVPTYGAHSFWSRNTLPKTSSNGSWRCPLTGAH